VAQVREQRLDLASAQHDQIGAALLFQSVGPEITDFGETVLADRTCLLPFAETAGIERIERACIFTSPSGRSTPLTGVRE